MVYDGRLMVVDDPQARKRERGRLLTNAVTLARWLHRDLRVFSEDFELTRAVRDSDLRIEWSRLKMHNGNVRTLLKELESESDMVLLEVTRKECLSQQLQDWKVELLEGCETPILIVPANYGLKNGGFDSFFVPMSGEARDDAALDWAIRKGHELHVPVDVFHVSSGECGLECDHSIVGHVSDEFHHEYPRLVEQFISQASPYTSERQKKVIRTFRHGAGDPFLLIQGQVKGRRHGLLVMEWKGRFKPGRARLIKQMVGRGELPVLLVRQSKRARSTLKVGDRFEAA